MNEERWVGVFLESIWQWIARFMPWGLVRACESRLEFSKLTCQDCYYSDDCAMLGAAWDTGRLEKGSLLEMDFRCSLAWPREWSKDE